MSNLNPPASATEISAFFTWMGEDGICMTVTKPQVEITVENAIENSKVVNGFYKTKKYPLFIDSRNIKSMSRDARKHFSTNGRETKINCMAIMVSSPVSKVIGNFFMGLNKPAIPARLFDNENDALDWLKKHR